MRRIVVAGAAAVALAGCGASTIDSPVDGATEATNAASPTPSHSPTGLPTASVRRAPSTSPVAPGVVTAITGGERMGPPPAVPWLQRRTLHLHAHETVELPRPYREVAVVGGRVYGVTAVDGAETVEVLDLDGSLVDSRPVEGSLAVNPAGHNVAWAEPGGHVVTAWDDSTVEMARQPGPVQAVAISGDGSCLEVEGGCTVWFNGPDGPRLTTSHGFTDIFTTSEPVAVTDAAPGRVVVLTEVTDDGSCSALLDRRGRALWETCDHLLLRLSPGLGRVLATDAYADGLGPGSLAVLDAATGTPLARWRVASGFVGAQAWEDEDHVLAVVYAAGSWHVVRLAVASGAVERVAASDDSAAEDDRPFVLTGPQ